LAQGWTDAIGKLHAGQPVYTFWDYFRKRWARDAGLRIDHLLLNAPAASKLAQAGVDKAVRGREKPSDHAPAWVVLR
jgi:exodeoxyribonuclease-3